MFDEHAAGCLGYFEVGRPRHAIQLMQVVGHDTTVDQAFGEFNQGFELVVDADDRDEALRLLPLVSDTVARLDVVDSAARGFAADELLELKNDAWLEGSEPVVTKADFVARMSIETVAFGKEGGYAIWYDDGYLFFGHGICVTVGSRGKPEEASIHG